MSRLGKLAGTVAGLAVGLSPFVAIVGRAAPPPQDPAPAPSEAKAAAEPAAAPAANRAQAEAVRRPPPLPPHPPSILPPQVQPIDLPTALRLAGVQNPELNVARAQVVEAAALRILAAAQILPTLNGGMNYDNHTGNLQQSNGNILSLNRSAVYVGAGSNAVAAGTVAIPGLVLSGNVGRGVFGFLVSRQVVRVREFDALETRNQVFLQVTLAYSELLRAEGQLAIARQSRDEALAVAELTGNYFATGEGRQSDADRAATELARREADIQEFEGRVLAAAARLAQLLNLPPTPRLHPTDAWVTPCPLVPAPIPVAELIAIALLRRPELAARRANVAASLLSLEGAQVLPFSPTVLVGFSAGGFGGGSNLVTPIFGGFGARSDFDALTYWTIQNLGVGNLALINAARARLQVSRFQELAVLNLVRAQVAEAYAKSHARFAQIATNEQAIRSGQRAFAEDFQRTQGGGMRLRQVLPIELLNSFDLMARARINYVDSIIDYNRAQFELYVALGQPPAAALARPVPTAGIIDRGGTIVPIEPGVPGVPPGAPIRGNEPLLLPPGVASRNAPKPDARVAAARAGADAATTAPAPAPAPAPAGR